MKAIFEKLFLFLFVLLTFNAASAQLRKIPAEVTDRFTQQYPMATSIEWRDRLKGFSADFRLNDTTYTAYYSNDGDWTSTEYTIEEDQLPDAVKESYSKSKYADWEITLAQRLLLPGGVTQYRVQTMKSDIRKRNLYFNAEGRMLRDLVTL